MKITVSFFVSLMLLTVFCLADTPSLQMEGNYHLKSGKIKNLAVLPEDMADSSREYIYQWLVEFQEILLLEYERLGFFGAYVDVKLTKDSTGENLQGQLHIIIDEGERYNFGKVELKTLDNSIPLVQKSELKIQPGEPYNGNFPQTDLRYIRRKYGEQGYVKRIIRQTFNINDSLKNVDVIYQIDPGYVMVFDTLIIHNKREGKQSEKPGLTNIQMIQNLLSIEKGEKVMLSKLGLFKSRLKSTQNFNYIRLRDSSLVQGKPGSALILDLEERVPGRLNSSLFWESQDGLGVESIWQRRNLMGRFYEGKALLRLAQRRQRVLLGLANPLLFGYKLRLSNELDMNWRQNAGLNDNESIFEANLSSSLIKPIYQTKFISRLEFESTPENSQSAVSPDVIRLGREQVIKLNFIQSWDVPLVDNDFNPKKGMRFKFIWGNGGTVVQDEVFAISRQRHNWLELKNSFYYSLPSYLIWAWRFDVGSFFSEGGANSRRFFMGGRNSIRNQDLWDVCPEINEVITGDDNLEQNCNLDVAPSYFLTSFEFRLELFQLFSFAQSSNLRFMENLQLVPFWDYGRIWNMGNSYKSGGRGMDVGLGLRIPVVIFNVRLDYAVGYKAGLQWDKWRIQFDLAQAF